MVVSSHRDEAMRTVGLQTMRHSFSLGLQACNALMKMSLSLLLYVGPIKFLSKNV